MLKPNFRLAILASYGLLTSGAEAGQRYVPPYGSDSIQYGRTYSALHLKRHPHQQVTAIQVDHELGDYVVVPDWIKGYTAASLTGLIQTRKDGFLAIHWACRDATDGNDRFLACIPKHPTLQMLMGHQVEFKVYTLEDSSNGVPSREYIEFPSVAAFFPLRAPEDIDGENEVTLLGAGIPGSSDDTVFRLNRISEN